MTFKELILKSDPKRKRISKLIDYNEFCSFKSNQTNESAFATIRSIPIEDLKRLIEDEGDNISLIDVRTPYEYSLEKIPGSTLIPLDEIESGDAIDQIRELVLSRRLYIYCKSGIRSAHALLTLQGYGIEGFNVTGGIKAWNTKKNE